MGLLDAPALPTLGSAVPLMGRLAAGVDNAQIIVMGDSTGDETTVSGRWPLLTAQWLASKYPAYTVNFRHWNFTTEVYDTVGSGKSQTIQTGTAGGSAPVLTIWNGSASGTSPTYHLNSTRFLSKLIAPVTAADVVLVIVNHGHNIGSASGIESNHQIYQLTRTLRDFYPAAGLMLTAQNPMQPGVGDATLDYQRARAAQSLAASEGYGLVNVFARFLQDPSYVTNLLAGDGLHPSTAGSQVWAQELRKHLIAASSTTVPAAGPVASHNRMFIPASAFVLNSGSPTFALVNGVAPGWSQPNAAVSKVTAVVDVPSHWAQYDTYVYWTVASSSGFTGASRVAFRLQRQNIHQYASMPVGAFASAPGGLTDTGVVANVGPSNGSAYQTFVHALSTQSAHPKSPVAVTVYREGTNAADNVAEATFLLGALLTRSA